MKKRNRAVMLAVCLVAGSVSLAGCSAKQVNLKTKGLEMIGLMDEKASNEVYASLFSESEELNKIIEQIAEGDYTNPQKVYEIKLDVQEYFQNAEIDISGMSENLQEELANKVSTGIGSRINSLEGSAQIAASSILMESNAFQGDDLKSPVIYLYQFGEAGNAAMVTFVPAEEGVISASALFLAGDEINSLSSVEEVENWLLLHYGMENAEVKEVNQR